MKKNVCYFLFGPDSYRSAQAVQAIERRFLASQSNMADLTRYDLEEVSLDTLKQTLLTIPFFTSHRLFILTHPFAAPKATQEGVMRLMEQVSSSTVVVFYETRTCDKRLALYQWLTKQAKVQEFPLPVGQALRQRIEEVARGGGVAVDSAAVSWLAEAFAADTLRLALETKKLASYVRSQGRASIILTDLQALCRNETDEPLFSLTDSLRRGSLGDSVRLYQNLITREDPMLLAATLASQIRALAKIYVRYRQGRPPAAVIARDTGLNPYVVKLALPLAQRLGLRQIRQAYADLVWFDAAVKRGEVDGSLGILLLILRLHGNLKSMRRSTGV